MFKRRLRLLRPQSIESEVNQTYQMVSDGFQHIPTYSQSRLAYLEQLVSSSLESCDYTVSDSTRTRYIRSVAHLTSVVCDGVMQRRAEQREPILGNGLAIARTIGATVLLHETQARILLLDDIFNKATNGSESFIAQLGLGFRRERISNVVQAHAQEGIDHGKTFVDNRSEIATETAVQNAALGVTEYGLEYTLNVEETLLSAQALSFRIQSDN